MGEQDFRQRSSNFIYTCDRETYLFIYLCILTGDWIIV